MNSHNVSVGARSSPLSLAQCDEVLQELRTHHPEVLFSLVSLKTRGDKDLKTSLRHLEKTDFFTREIDNSQLAGDFRISIHSAKDLPEPLRDGLSVVALTKGVDPSDVLVVNTEILPEHPTIATSSIRREEEVKRRFPTATIVDIRGNIQQRLAILDSGKVDGVVMAKAALLRLGLDERLQIPLDGPVAPLQGRLAVIARSDDHEMATLFSCIDCRPTMLYVGLEAPRLIEKKVIHCPLIKTVPCPLDATGLSDATHVIVTSKSAVRYLFEEIAPDNSKEYISVGTSTSKALASYGITRIHTAETESQEGIMEVISSLNHPNPCFFWPHSELSRDNLEAFLKEKGYRYTACVLYDTVRQKPEQLIHFDAIDEIFFSSPSTVDAFFHFFGPPPHGKTLSCQGTITQQALTQNTSFQTSNNKKDFIYAATTTSSTPL